MPADDETGCGSLAITSTRRRHANRRPGCGIVKKTIHILGSSPDHRPSLVPEYDVPCRCPIVSLDARTPISTPSADINGMPDPPPGRCRLARFLAASSGRTITEQRRARAWPRATGGLRATEADLLVEVTASPMADGEPGLTVTHMREALQHGIPVVTSSKWPVALRGAEPAALARSQGVPFSAEPTVMSGTPVLSALTEGLAGTVPVALRGGC